MPTNDNIADALVVEIPVAGGTYNSPLVDNAALTKEAGEPMPTMNDSSANLSAWWRYQPLSSGAANFDTGATVAGSSSDSEMAVYRQDGSGFAGLVKLASNQDSSPAGGYRAYIAGLPVSAGATYYIQVGSYNAQTMQYGLAVTGPETAVSNPAGNLAASLPLPTVALSGTYTDPDPTGALDANLPLPIVALEGAYSGPISGSLGATLPLPTVALSGTYTGEGPPPPEVVRNGLGLVLDSSATVDVVAPLDSGSLSSTVPLHIIAATVPVPTLVAGRPS